jgi:hypothetical protein
MMQGLVIGIVGSVLGAIGRAGAGVGARHYQFIEIPGDVYFIDRLPVAFDIGDFSLILGLSVLISFLATIYPARQAAPCCRWRRSAMSSGVPAARVERPPAAGGGDRRAGHPRSSSAATARRCASWTAPTCASESGESIAIIGESGAGQVDAAAHPGRLDRPTAGLHRGAPTSARRSEALARAAQRAHRLRLPVPPPAARVHRAGERDDAAADRR